MRKLHFIIILAGVIFTYNCSERYDVQPDVTVDYERSRVVSIGEEPSCEAGYYYDMILMKCVPDGYKKVEEEAAQMGRSEIVYDMKMMYRTLGNTNNTYTALYNAKAKRIITPIQYSYTKGLMDDLFNSNSVPEIKDKLRDYRVSLQNPYLNQEDKLRLNTYADLVEDVIDDVLADPANANLAPNDALQAVLCALSILGWIASVIGLLTATVASAGLLGMVAVGVGYSISTALLATCFL